MPPLDHKPDIAYDRSNPLSLSFAMNISSQTNPTIPRCPRCRAKDVIKKGTCKTRHETRPRWGCNRCGYAFIDQVSKHSPYLGKVIMETIGRYNLVYSACWPARGTACQRWPRHSSGPRSPCARGASASIPPGWQASPTSLVLGDQRPPLPMRSLQGLRQR